MVHLDQTTENNSHPAYSRGNFGPVLLTLSRMLIILQNSALLQNVRFFANSIAVVNFIEIQ